MVSGPISLARARRTPRAAWTADALGDLTDADLLTLLLGPGTDGARLLEAAGGLAGLVRVQPVPLPGLAGRGAERRLRAAAELWRRLAAAGARPGWRVRSPADVGERLRPAMQHLEQEELRSLLLDTKNRVVADCTVYVGNLAGSSVRVGEVFREAVRRQAAAVVVVHNHPSGDPTPSADDLRITAELAQAGRLLDIELLDHVVVGVEGWVSIRALGGV